MKALTLKDWNIKRAMQHEAIKGKKPIGRGAFSLVFDGSKPSTVYKLTVDRIGYWMLNCDAAKVEGKHFPKVHKSFSEVGETRIKGEEFAIYLFEMERLQPIRRGQAAYREAQNIMEATFWGNYRYSTDNRINNILHSKVEFSKSIRKALKDLERFALDYNNDMELDLHNGNFMQRKNGTLVITDPMADRKLFRYVTGQC